MKSKLFLSLVLSTCLLIPSDQKLYNYEICFKALKMIMDPILQSGMGCLNMYEGGAFILLCLVSILLKCIQSNIFKCSIPIYSNETLTCVFNLFFKRECAWCLTLVLKKWGKWAKKIASIFLLMFSSYPFVSIEKQLAIDLDNEKMQNQGKMKIRTLKG